ncbi:MAG: Fur family transcriptional regulator [Anaerolineaceae bacterium]
MKSEINVSWQNILSQNNYRLTAPRLAVVEVIASSGRILNPMEVYLEARLLCQGLGLVTVYRTIEKLEELGLVQRVHLPGGCHSFIAAAEGHQHLIICSRCNRAEYFSGDDLTPIIGDLKEKRGFLIQDHWLQLSGLCQICQQKEKIRNVQ